MTWRAILAWLASLTADPAVIDAEGPKAAAAVLVAVASLERDEAAPQPEPAPGGCCKDCGGTGSIRHADGHRTPCPCPPSCKCKKQACPDGKCKL